jgi:hypothetical protein
MQAGLTINEQLNAEHRAAPRLRSLLAAKIIFNNGNSTLDCLVRNISESGAKLAVSTVVTLPERFDLLIPQKGTARRAQIRWRNADEIGVTFVDVSASGGAAVSNEAALRQRIRELEAEVARLNHRIAQLTAG